MIPINNHPRKVGILAAREYILSRNPGDKTLQELERSGTWKGQMPCLHGINLSMKRRLKNAIGRSLPIISL
jgi:hypothetical protein